MDEKRQKILDELARRELAKRDLKHFIDYTTYGFEEENFHAALFKCLTQVADGELKRLIVQLPPRAGKEIANSCLVPTPHGWKKHGEILEGEEVFAVNGKPQKVLAVIPQEEKCSLEVTTSAGDKIKVHPNHEWTVFDRSKQKEVTIETREMIGKLWNPKRGKRGSRARFQLPAISPVEYQEQETIIDPYALGFWLGDGTTNEPSITFCPEDLEEALRNIPYQASSIVRHNKTGVPRAYFPELLPLLKEEGLRGNKFVPRSYIENSIKKRKELLRGLIDSDGTVDKTGRVTFTNANEKLVDAVQEIVASLGVRVCRTEEEPRLSSSGIHGRQKLFKASFSFCDCAKLERKKSKTTPQKRKIAIVEISPCEEEPGQCLQVETGIYLVGKSFTPTHNSEIISKRFPAWLLGKDPSHQIVCCSYASSLATEFGRKTRQIVLEDRCKNVFPDLILADDKKEGGNWETTEGGGYYSVGIGGALTGRGFSCGIIDDPVKNREEAESEVYREKIWNWYTSTFLTRQQGGNAAIVILMTRWNTDDLVGRILESEKNKWKVLSFPAIDAEGKPLCQRPGFGIDFYREQENAIGTRDFAALYQQDPIASSGSYFNKEEFKYFALSDLTPDEFETGVFIDPAFSSREASDETAIAAVARHKITKELYLLDLFADTVLPSSAQDLALSWMEKWKEWNPRFLSSEEVSISKDQQLFTKEIDRKMRENGRFYTMLPFKPAGKGKKEERIKYSLEPLFNRGVIHFRIDDSGNKAWAKLEEQLLRFPFGKRDDLADVLAQAAIVWQERGVGSNQDLSKITPFNH